MKTLMIGLLAATTLGAAIPAAASAAIVISDHGVRVGHGHHHRVRYSYYDHHHHRHYGWR
jgi:hypothetical protein